MGERAEVDPGVVGELRAICLALPEAHEEPAWVGTRWRIRTKTFAHVLRIDDGWPPAYVKVVGSDGPLTVLTFRTAGPAILAVGDAGPPFFLPGWWDDIAGMVLDARTDWAEVAALVTDSYCALAPKRLAQTVDRPPS